MALNSLSDPCECALADARPHSIGQCAMLHDDETLERLLNIEHQTKEIVERLRSLSKKKK